MFKYCKLLFSVSNRLKSVQLTGALPLFFNNILGLAQSVVINDQKGLECCSRLGYYDVENISKYEKVKKQNEEEKIDFFSTTATILILGMVKTPS